MTVTVTERDITTWQLRKFWLVVAVELLLRGGVRSALVAAWQAVRLTVPATWPNGRTLYHVKVVVREEEEADGRS